MISAALTAAAVTAAESSEGEHNVLLPATYDLVWSVVAVGIIVVVFWRWVLPKFQAVLDERTAKIEGGLEKAATVQAEADAALAQLTTQLAEARTEAAKMREEARAEGAAIVAEARAGAQAEASRILETAQRQIEAERRAAAVQLRTDVGTLATQLAEKIVGESLQDEALRSRVVDRFLDDLETGLTAETKGS